MGSPNNEYRKRLRVRLVQQFGGRCEECGVEEGLEFAHVEPTGLNGEGRGRAKRIFDVKKNPRSYRLLCMTCHDVLDGRTPRKRQRDI